MSESDRDDGVNRRKVLECMTWVGTGVLWTISGGVPHSLGIMGEAQAQDGERPDLPADQRQPCRFRQAGQSECARHARRGHRQGQCAAEEARLHDPYRRHQPSVAGVAVRRRRPHHLAVAPRRALRARRARFPRSGPEILSWTATARPPKAPAGIQFDANGVHFIGLVNVVDLKAGGLGNLGTDQLEWLEADVKGRSASTPIVVFAHIPLWTVYPDWGWGTRRRRPGAVLSQALRLGDRAQRPHPSGDAEGRGQRHVPHRALDRLSAAGAGHRSLARAAEGPRRPAAHHARHRQRHVQAERAAARDHRHAAARLRRIRHVHREHFAERTRCGGARRSHRDRAGRGACFPAGRKTPRRRARCRSTISPSRRQA